jgi:hypothetical protein
MYFSGLLAIDPSQMTVIRKIKPTKLFGKLLDALTGGRTSDKEEQETFTAISIMQHINMGLRSMNIKNVIRLSVNEYDFYLDESGKDDDMKQAMLEFETKIDPLESETFEKIFLVVEHERTNMKYLVEIEIDRCHKVGRYPIIIKINGLISDLQLKPGETKEDLEKRMSGIFESQQTYHQFIKSKEALFNQFTDELAQAIKKYIKVDDVIKETTNKMIRPKEKVEKPEQIRPNRQSEPMYYGYYGIGDYLFYSMLWSTMCYNHNIYVNDFHMVDENGSEVMAVGDNGFYAGDTDTLNAGSDFEPPADGDVDYYGGNEFEGQLEESNLVGDATAESYSGDSGDWLGGGDGGDAGGCSSCSSCSSCGGCGGCGGCS